MDWQDKAKAIDILSALSIRIHDRNDWSADIGDVTIKGDGVLTSTMGRGNTPQKAIEDLWRQLTDLKANQCIVAVYRDVGELIRKHYRWETCIWKEIPRERKEHANDKSTDKEGQGAKEAP
jgi:flavodoxin